MEFEIRPIYEFGPEEMDALAPNGYTSQERYILSTRQDADGWRVELLRQGLAQPYVKRWGEENNDFELYQAAAESGFSFGAYMGEKLVGVCLAELRIWNASLFVQMLQVAGEYRGQGIGAGLLKNLCAKAREAHFRLIDLETQNTNVPAIDFYLKQGFCLGGLDWMLYDPKVVDSFEMALFMKKRL